MRHRSCVAMLLMFVLWLALPRLGTSAAQDATPISSLTIQLPHDIAPERVAIFYSLVQRGWPKSIATKPGIFDYTVETGAASDTKLLLFVPGFRIVTAEFTDAEVRTTARYTPTLVPSRATLSGRLVDSAGQPLRNYGLTLGYKFIEACDFFKCGPDGPIPVISLGDTRTGDAGAFSFVVPNFHDDPFFQGRTSLDAGALFLSSGARGTPDLSDDTLRPSILHADAVDASPVVITHINHGILSGRLGKGFLGQHGIGSDLSSYRFGMTPLPDRRPVIGLNAAATPPIDGFLGYDARLKADGTFDVSLTPGTYELKLGVDVDGVQQRFIVVATGVAVRENQRTVVDRP